ncbi:MAG: FMN-binding protein [Aeromicrobium sp.]
MIRTTAVPRSLRAGTALVGVAGIVALAGCAGTTAATEEDASSASSAAPTSAATGSAEEGAAAGAGAYADGTYEAEGSYRTPETTETIDVTITLESDVITAVEVTGDPQAPQSQQYQSRFIGGISDEVVGKNIDEISVSRVAGSSLTSGGFNDAVETIKSEAAA